MWEANPFTGRNFHPQQPAGLSRRSQGAEIWKRITTRINRKSATAKPTEKIRLQVEYENEDQARARITAAIPDYNHRRPNAGNSGFAPSSVRLLGRKSMNERRKTARQRTNE